MQGITINYNVIATEIVNANNNINEILKKYLVENSTMIAFR